MLSILAAAAVAAAPVDPSADSRVSLVMHSAPEGAEMLVVPLAGSAKPYQCRAPCTVKIPSRMPFQIYAIEHGYRMGGADAAVSWIAGPRGTYDLSTHEVTFRLVPATPAP